MCKNYFISIRAFIQHQGSGIIHSYITITPSYFHRKIKKISTVEPNDIINS